MNKKTVLILLLGLIAYHIYGVYCRDSVVIPEVPVVPKTKIIDITQDEIINTINNVDVKKYVEALASQEFEGRGTGSKGNTAAADYIKKHLDGLNIPYKEQAFTARGNKTTNIIGYLLPKKQTSDSIIVIGAHYDHLGSRGGSYYPGADDNASGVAGVMSVATALSKYKNKLNHTILLQFYSGEELGLLGSKYYVENPLFPELQPDISKHMAMINLDMIGYLKSNYNLHDNTTTYRDCHEWRIFNYSDAFSLRNIVKELSAKYSFAENISGYRPGGSDHAPFYNKGIPVVFLHTGSHPNYHRTTDTPDKLNYNGLSSVAKLALEILLEVDKVK